MIDQSHSTAAGLGTFERWLSIWVALAIGAGLLIGNLFPRLFATLASWEIASVNLPVAVLIWAMVYPMMVGVDFGALRRVGDKPKGLVVTLVVNWLIKPFTMAALGVLFFNYVFAGLIPADDAQAYLAGVILLGAAPCTAMVFVWSNLTRGDATYTLVQVSVNDIIMVFAFAPIVAFLLGLTDIVVPWNTLLLSVVLYVLLRDAPAVGGLSNALQAGRKRGRARHHSVQVASAAVFDPRSAGHSGIAIRIPRQSDLRTPARHRTHRRSTADSVLWHLFLSLWCGSDVGHTLQCCRTLRINWHF